jgi:hypothetical protein
MPQYSTDPIRSFGILEVLPAHSSSRHVKPCVISFHMPLHLSSEKSHKGSCLEVHRVCVLEGDIDSANAVQVVLPCICRTTAALQDTCAWHAIAEGGEQLSDEVTKFLGLPDVILIQSMLP